VFALHMTANTELRSHPQGAPALVTPAHYIERLIACAEYSYLGHTTALMPWRQSPVGTRAPGLLMFFSQGTWSTWSAECDPVRRAPLAERGWVARRTWYRAARQGAPALVTPCTSHIARTSDTPKTSATLEALPHASIRHNLRLVRWNDSNQLCVCPTLPEPWSRPPCVGHTNDNEMD